MITALAPAPTRVANIVSKPDKASSLGLQADRSYIVSTTVRLVISEESAEERGMEDVKRLEQQ